MMRQNKLLCPNYCVQFLNAPDIIPDKMLKVSNVAPKDTECGTYGTLCVLIFKAFKAFNINEEIY